MASTRKVKLIDKVERLQREKNQRWHETCKQNYFQQFYKKEEEKKTKTNEYKK